MKEESKKNNEVKEQEVKNEETKEEVKNEETQKNNEETQKPSKSFLDTMSSIWNSKPMKFVRKTVKVTLITGAALIGVTGAAKAGAAMALEEHDAKASGGSDSEEIPDEIPGDYEDVEDIPEEDSENSEES